MHALMPPVLQSLLTVRSKPVPVERKMLYRVLAVIGVLIGIGSLSIIISTLLQPDITIRLQFRLASALVRNLILIGGCLWVAATIPWRASTPVEQRQGFVINVIMLIFLALYTALFIFQFNSNLLINRALGLQQIATCVLIWYLSRQGFVALSANIILLGLLLLTASATGGDYVFFVIAILLSSLLLRWWVGLVMAVAVPFLLLGLQTIGLIAGETTLTRTINDTLFMLAISGITSLYGYSFEQAIRQADARTTELQHAQATLEDSNRTLQEQSAALRHTQQALEDTIATQQQRIDEAIATLRQRSVEMRSLQTPLIRVAAGVLVAPLIGNWDAERADEFVTMLLRQVEAQRARVVVCDLTGLDGADEFAIIALARVLSAAQLLGCRCVIVGVRPEAAQSLVHMQIDLYGAPIAADLAAGLELAKRTA